MLLVVRLTLLEAELGFIEWLWFCSNLADLICQFSLVSSSLCFDVMSICFSQNFPIDVGIIYGSCSWICYWILLLLDGFVLLWSIVKFCCWFSGFARVFGNQFCASLFILGIVCWSNGSFLVCVEMFTVLWRCSKKNK